MTLSKWSIYLWVYPAAVALKVLAIDIHVYASDLVQATEHAFNKSFDFADAILAFIKMVIIAQIGAVGCFKDQSSGLADAPGGLRLLAFVGRQS